MVVVPGAEAPAPRRAYMRYLLHERRGDDGRTAAEPEHADAVLSYLENPGIIPLPLRRLAERNPESATRVFRQVLGRPRFSWERDGERLLRRAKPEYYAEPVLPGVTPVGDRLARARMAGPGPAGPTRGGGRNTPRQGGKRTKRPRRRGR